MIIAPVAEAAGAVTLSRSDYEAPLSTAEDVADLAAVEAHRAHEVRVDWQAAREGISPGGSQSACSTAKIRSRSGVRSAACRSARWPASPRLVLAIWPKLRLGKSLAVPMRWRGSRARSGYAWRTYISRVGRSPLGWTASLPPPTLSGE